MKLASVSDNDYGLSIQFTSNDFDLFSLFFCGLPSLFFGDHLHIFSLISQVELLLSACYMCEMEVQSL